MTSHHNIFIGVLCPSYYTNNVMILNRTHLKMISDIKLQLKISPLLYHLFYNIILMFIKL